MWRVGEASFNDLVKKNVKISKMVEIFFFLFFFLKFKQF